MDPQHIRNFCIIAHIDHGKSTLADRLLEITGAIDPREKDIEQRLDSMELERERGITIKAKAVKLTYRPTPGQEQEYEFNLIDTPGHVDFSYEVSRSLAACEGALLLVDATQGIQAQTLANVYLALEHDLEIIPVVNKIDLGAAEPDAVADEIKQAFGFGDDEIIFASGKDGTGISKILDFIVTKVPSPKDNGSRPLRALIFDSKYDTYKGVVAYVRVFDGSIPEKGRIRVMSTGATSEMLEVGFFSPETTKTNGLGVGQVGYVATGLKTIGDAPVGDTITMVGENAMEPLEAYAPLKPMVFAGLYPADGEKYLDLRDALEKLRLNDSAIQFQPETSMALGSGFRCGFLGLLHMDVVQERLEREFGLTLLATSPGVAYRVIRVDGTEVEIDNPSRLPDQSLISEIREPWSKLTIVTPANFMGQVIDLVTGRGGALQNTEYLQYGEMSPGVKGIANIGRPRGPSATRVMLEMVLPLSEMLVDFYDQLKSQTQGYASMDYVVSEYRKGNLVRLDILVNGETVDALSVVVHREGASEKGRELASRLKELIPRQLFEVPIQAAIGGKIVARETVRALRKNVLAKCYGGDVTRKRKLLEKQAEGKKRMKRVGAVEIPQEAFLSILKMEK